MENIFQTGLLTQDEILNLCTRKLDKKLASKIKNIKVKIKKQIQEPLYGKEGIDFCVCPICKFKTTRALKSHMNVWHPAFDWESFIKKSPDYIVYCETTKNKTIITGDSHWTKKEESKKILSDRVKGKNNPNHKSKTTKQKRLETSPKSIEFYKRKYPELSLDEQKRFLRDHIEKTKKNTPKESRPQNKEYWMNKGYSEKKAIQKVKERQAVGSLENFIKRYGEIEGLNKWNLRQEKWLKNYKKSNYSKISQTLFWELFYNIKNIPNDEIYFATFNSKNINLVHLNKNNEYVLKLENCTIKPDFFIKSQKK